MPYWWSDSSSFPVAKSVYSCQIFPPISTSSRAIEWLKDSVRLDQKHHPAKRLQMRQKSTGQKNSSSLTVHSTTLIDQCPWKTISWSVIGRALYDSCHTNTRLSWANTRLGWDGGWPVEPTKRRLSWASHDNHWHRTDMESSRLRGETCSRTWFRRWSGCRVSNRSQSSSRSRRW